MQFWNSIETLGLAGAVLNIIAVLAAVASALAWGGALIVEKRINYLQPPATLGQVQEVGGRIANIGGHLKLQLSWAIENVTPFGEPPFGGELGSEVVVEIQPVDAWAEPGSALMVLRRNGPYKIQYLNRYEGLYDCDLEVHPGSYPLGKQIDDLKKLKFVRIIVPLRQYNIGTQIYDVSVSESELTLNVNGLTSKQKFQGRSPTKPKRLYENALTGYIDHSFPLSNPLQFQKTN